MRKLEFMMCMEKYNNSVIDLFKDILFTTNNNVKVVPDTDLGYRKMKKRIMFAIATIAVSVTAIVGLS